MNAARTPEWSLGLDRSGRIMATRDSGDIGHPWVILAERAGRRLRVSAYRPGDDTDVEGDVLAEIAGNPRELGRQLRTLLSDFDIDA
jgi:hypothetical protein